MLKVAIGSLMLGISMSTFGATATCTDIKSISTTTYNSHNAYIGGCENKSDETTYFLNNTGGCRCFGDLLRRQAWIRSMTHALQTAQAKHAKVKLEYECRRAEL